MYTEPYWEAHNGKSPFYLHPPRLAMPSKGSREDDLRRAEAERAAIERALSNSENLARLAMHAGRMFAFEWNPSIDEVRRSEDAGDIIGLTDRATREMGKDSYQRVHPDDRECLVRTVRSLTPANDKYEIEYRVVQPNGQIANFRQTARGYFDEQGELVRLIGVTANITDRKQAEDALRQNELVYKQVLDNIPDCIFVLDVTPERRFKIVSFNPAEEKVVGMLSSDVAGKFVEDIVPEDTASKVTANYRRCLDAGTIISYEEELPLSTGLHYFRTHLIPVRDAEGHIYRIVGCCNDLTEVKRLQEEALARQKLEGLGVLANGVAHDFNNLLGGILASAELALADAPPVSSVEQELMRIRTACIRGAEVVGQLMLYAGNERPTFEPLDISALVSELLGFLKVSISKHAILEADLSSDLPAVLANAAQIRQAVMNLVINASDAIGERDGTIRVTTKQVKVEAGSSIHDAGKPPAGHDAGKPPAGHDAGNLPAGNYVQLKVSDTGCGMTPDVQARIFDPFFTTKGAGRGLGLAAVQGIIRGHGGTLNVTSCPGQGSSFESLLPCIEGPGGTSEIAVPASAHETAEPVGTVLVVEDEELLRVAVAKMLRKAGFTVIEARDGTAAVETIRAYKNPLDILFLDLTLPGTPSREILDEARRLRPKIRVIITSAYSREISAVSVGGGIEHFIRKPYRGAALVGLIRQALS
jgi:two-component system, cell cycle sensor histidine kinase and response regulator CckA